MADILSKAKEFAVFAHEDQKYGSEPYLYHLESVYKVAKRFGISDKDILAACYLHDILEDTATPLGQLTREFGSSVASIVSAVTDDPGSNRLERHKLTYPRTRRNSKAVAVKLCDRIANVERGGKVDMYKKEYPFFKSILYKSGEYESLWKHLDKLLRA